MKTNTKKKSEQKLKSKQWQKPKSDTLRLGFEVTMYAGVDPVEI